MKTQTMTKLMTLALVAALLSACGHKSTMGADDQASRVDPGTAETSTKPMAYCSRASSTYIATDLQAYVDPFTKKIQNDLTFLRVKSVSDQFKTAGNYIQIFRWKASSTGSTYIDTDPLEFRLVNKDTSVSIRGYSKALGWAEVQTIANKYGMNVSVPQDFFDKTVFVVNTKDTLADYDVLKTALYNTSNVAIGEVDALIPIFSANPVDYAVENDGGARPTVLQNIHPFKGSVGQGWTNSHYITESNNVCIYPR